MATRLDIQRLIQASLINLDPTLDVSPGSRAYSKVIQPILEVLGPDPLQMDSREFVRSRLEQEYPSMASEGEGAMDDLVAKPLSLIVGSLREQILRINQRQSVRNPALLTDRDGDMLAANWFVGRDPGARATVDGRLFFSSPRALTVTSANRWSTGSGLSFFTSTTQSVTAEEMSLNRSGDLFYADFRVRAQYAGQEYSIDEGALSSISGIPDVVRVTNPKRASGGLLRETTGELIDRTRGSLVERSTTNPRGIFARLRDNFGGLRNLEVVGYNDPEMQRDLLTGAGHGKVAAAGRAFVFGTYALFFSSYEDRGDSETLFIEAGHSLEIHYGKLLYGLGPELRHEKLTIEDVVFDSRKVIEQLPAVLVLRLDRAPSNASTTAMGGLPGFLPAVGAVIQTEGKITISNIPGGIQAPITAYGPVEVLDGQVHLGGHHDVWMRPQVSSEGVVTVRSLDDEHPILAGLSLKTLGTTGTPNVVESTDITLDWVARGVRAGMHLYVLEGADRGVYRLLAVRAKQLVLDANLAASDLDLRFKIMSTLEVNPVLPRVLKVPFGSTAPGVPLRTVIGSATVWLDINLIQYGTTVGDIVRILDGDDAGDYVITAFDSVGGGTAPILDRPMSNSVSGLRYEVFTSNQGIQLPLVRIQPGGVTLLDSSDQPTDITIPYALPVEARALHSVTGSKEKGKGSLGFSIPGLGSIFENMGEACPSDLDKFLARMGDEDTDNVLDDVLGYYVANQHLYSSCQTCDGYIFCVTIDADGLFINYDLPDAGKDLVNDIAEWLTKVAAAFFPSFVSSTPAVIEVVDGGIRINPNKQQTGVPDSNWGVVQFEVCLPEELVGCCSNLYVAFPDFDLVGLFRALSDWVKAYDVLIATGSSSGLGTVLKTIRDLIPRKGPDLCKAVPGDTLEVADGPNRGGYIIDTVYEFSLEGTMFGTGLGLASSLGTLEGNDLFWMNALLMNLAANETGSQIGDLLDDFYNNLNPLDAATVRAAIETLDDGLSTFLPILKMCAVGIQGQFPVDPWKPFCDLFDVGVPSIPNLPAPPNFDLDCYDDYEGNPKDPFDILVEFAKWFLEFLEILGLEINTDFNVTFSEILGGFLNSLASKYKLGSSTCDATLRLYFVEPTTFEASGGRRCVGTPDLSEDPVGTFYGKAEVPTTFSTTVGSKEVLFAATQSPTPHQVVPPQESVEDMPATEWPRDLEVGSSATVGVHKVASAKFTNLANPAAALRGIRPHQDTLEIHPEILLLASSVVGVKDTVRIPAVTVKRGSNLLTLPPAMQATSAFKTQLDEGDLVFLEEGLDVAGYFVTKVVNDYQFEIDKPVTETTLSIVRDGVDGSYDAAGPTPSRFSSTAAPFLSTDVGKYLTVYGSHYPSSNGSYRILAVDVLGGYVDLDIPSGGFVGDETGVFWLVALAPAADPSSVPAGGTELVGVRPFRIYHGTALRQGIAALSDSLDPTVATFTVDVTDIPTTLDYAALDLSTASPYRIVRDGVQRISSTQMENNKEGGLFYFDVGVRSLEVGPVANVPKGQRFDAVFGTYRADGYWYKVEDTNFTFSPQEKLLLVFSGDFLPVGRGDSLANRVPLAGQGFQLLYDYAPLVGQIHQFLVSQGERTVNANPLGRHFLPSFVYLDVATRGGSGDPSDVAESLRAAIEMLNPLDAISVAALEGILGEAGVTDWDHDITIVAVTHDLDRRLVGNRSTDRLGGTDPQYFHGSNRTSFFIAGPNRSPDQAGNYANDSDVDPGERVRVTRTVRVRNLR